MWSIICSFRDSKLRSLCWLSVSCSHHRLRIVNKIRCFVLFRDTLPLFRLTKFGLGTLFSTVARDSGVKCTKFVSYCCRWPLNQLTLEKSHDMSSCTFQCLVFSVHVLTGLIALLFMLLQGWSLLLRAMLHLHVCCCCRLCCYVRSCMIDVFFSVFSVMLCACS